MKKSKCVYPGSFDPLSFGHLDIITRAACLFDEVHVAILNNTSKKYMFSLSERLRILENETKGIGNVFVHSFDGLLVDFLKSHDIDVVVRGVRNATDLELEERMANANRMLYSKMETVLLLSNPSFDHISSSIIKELITLHADVTSFVPVSVVEIINGRN